MVPVGKRGRNCGGIGYEVAEISMIMLLWEHYLGHPVTGPPLFMHDGGGGCGHWENQARRNVVSRIVVAGSCWYTSASVDQSVQVGEGTAVFAHAVVQLDTTRSPCDHQHGPRRTTIAWSATCHVAQACIWPAVSESERSA